MTLDRDVVALAGIVLLGAVLGRIFGRSECGQVPAGPDERGGRIRRLLLVD